VLLEGPSVNREAHRDLRRHFNVVVAAVANKLARRIWAVLSRDETYRAPA
jgi:hypothetical protein